MGLIDVEVVMQSESFDITEFLTGASRTGEIDATSVPDFVGKLKARSADSGSSIGRVNLFAHGTPSYISMGTDVIHAWTPKVHLPTLRTLRGIVASSGVVTLMVCQVGQSENLVGALAEALGARVQANKGDVRPLLGIGCGEWVIAWPDGTLARTPWGLPPY